MLTIAYSIAFILAVAIGALLLVASRKPDTFRVSRTAVIGAPPDRIFPFISDFRRWDAWSPWEKKDPHMKREFGGPDSGKGATYAWEGDKSVGTGRMRILVSEPPSKLRLALDFEKPFSAHNIVDFTLEPQGAATQVVWDMHGPVPFVGKIMHTIFDMDSMVGKDFEAGLASLKRAAEE